MNNDSREDIAQALWDIRDWAHEIILSRGSSTASIKTAGKISTKAYEIWGILYGGKCQQN